MCDVNIGIVVKQLTGSECRLIAKFKHHRGKVYHLHAFLKSYQFKHHA